MSEQQEPLRWGRIAGGALLAAGASTLTTVMVVAANAFRLGAEAKGAPDPYEIEAFATRAAPVIGPITLAIFIVVAVRWAARNTGARGGMTGGAMALLAGMPGFIMVGEPGPGKMFGYFGLIVIGYIAGEFAGRLPPAASRSGQWAGMLRRIEIVRGDITRQQVDAIVNPANPSLLGGSGIDGAIHRAAGPELLAECRKLGGCDVGEAKVTKGYQLPAPWVIHMVTPTWRGGTGGEDHVLAGCYRRCLDLATERGLKVIAFSSSTGGAYSYPIERAAPTALRAIATAVANMPNLENVIIVCTDPPSLAAYQEAHRGLRKFQPSVRLVPKRPVNA